MDKKLTQTTNDDIVAGDTANPEVPAGNPSRRRFTRDAVVGGAVLLSLGNRAAWGGTGSACLSASLLQSYFDNTSGFTSIHPDMLQAAQEIDGHTNGTNVQSLRARNGSVLYEGPGDNEICASSCIDESLAAGNIVDGVDEAGNRICP